MVKRQIHVDKYHRHDGTPVTEHERKIEKAPERETYLNPNIANTKTNQWWDVSLNGKNIDQVNFSPEMTAEEVKRSLINHDGYDSSISVRKRNILHSYEHTGRKITKGKEASNNQDVFVDFYAKGEETPFFRIKTKRSEAKRIITQKKKDSLGEVEGEIEELDTE